MPGNDKHRETIRSQCDRRLRDIPVPRPFSLPALTEALARHRGRNIRFGTRGPHCGTPHGPRGVPAIGMWIATDDADRVLIDAGASSGERELVALHEFGHMLCGHRPDLTRSAAGLSFDPGLTTALEQARSGRPWGTHEYSAEEELEADTMASLILGRCGTGPET